MSDEERIKYNNIDNRKDNRFYFERQVNNSNLKLKIWFMSSIHYEITIIGHDNHVLLNFDYTTGSSLTTTVFSRLNKTEVKSIFENYYH